jgi:ribose transport system substrate-binding protein
MKKILIFSLVMIFTLSVAFMGIACKEEQVTEEAAPAEEEAAPAEEEAAPAEEEEAPAEEEEAAEEPLEIYYIAADTTTHPFWRAQAGSMSEYAEELGVDLTILDAGNDTEQQTTQVESVVAKKPDAVIYCAVDTGVGVSHIAMMKDAGIPVVNNNRQVPEGTFDIEFSFAELDGAEASAQMIVDFLMDKYGEATGKLLEMQGALTDENAVIRSNGIHNIIDGYENIQIISKGTEWDLNKAGTAALDAFQANPDIDAVYLPSDYLLPAVISQVEDKPLAGEDGHVYIISLSGDSLSLSLIRDLTIDASFNMNVIQMALLSLDFAIDLTRGIVPAVGDMYEEDEPWGPIEVFEAEGGGVEMFVREYPVTIDNVDDPDLWGNQYELD